jgi:outer membrane immunogenic protein
MGKKGFLSVLLFMGLLVGQVEADTNAHWAGKYGGVFVGAADSSVGLEDADEYNGEDFDYDTAGVYTGVFGGYNWLYGNFVYGVEAEFGYLGLKDSKQYPDFVGSRGPDDSVASIDTDFYLAMTGRAGYLYNNTLFYIKGGISGLHTEVSFIDDDPEGMVLTSGTSTDEYVWAGTLGAGVEVSYDSHWSIRAEYMRMFVDKTLTHTASGDFGGKWTFKHHLDDIDLLKIGFSYRF